MALRIFRALWFISVLVLFASLIYGYAGWQENMIIQDEVGEQVSIGRDLLFYTMVGIFVLVNALVYVIAKLAPKEVNFRAWFHGLIVVINLFFIIALSLLGLYNSGESYDYSRLGAIIYGSLVLILVWAILWPLYLIYKKIFVKQAV
jgi:hypothetical protein